MCLAIPGKIISIQGEGQARTAEVDFTGNIRTISLVCSPDAGIGDYVNVHAGMAISIIDEEQAKITLAHFRMLQSTAGE